MSATDAPATARCWSSDGRAPARPSGRTVPVVRVLRAARHADRLLVAYPATRPSAAANRPAALATWAVGRFRLPERLAAPIQQGHDVAA